MPRMEYTKICGVIRGGSLSLGRGYIYSKSSEQKLNTKSSTEAELVTVSKVLPHILWTRHFLLE